MDLVIGAFFLITLSVSGDLCAIFKREIAHTIPIPLEYDLRGVSTMAGRRIRGCTAG